MLSNPQTIKDTEDGKACPLDSAQVDALRCKLSIVCAYSQNSNAGPHAEHFTMQGAYIDYFAGVGAGPMGDTSLWT